MRRKKAVSPTADERIQDEMNGKVDSEVNP